MKISLCLLVRNELGGCRTDVPLLPREDFYEVFAVDGASTDGTIEYLEGEGIAVHQQTRKSLNAAYHHAVEVATGDALIVFFPKGTIDPACLHGLAEALQDGVEMVIASRNIEGGANEEDGHFFRPRKWGVGALSLFASVVWRREGSRVHDVLHGVKGFTKDVFRRMEVSEMGVTVDLRWWFDPTGCSVDDWRCRSPKWSGRTVKRISR